MTEYTLWAGNPAPADINDASDGGAAGVTVGTGCLFGPDGSVVAIRFRATTTVGGSETYTIGLFDYVSQSLLGSKSVTGSSLTAGAWNRVDFDSPIAVDDEHAYVAVVWNSGGRYVASLTYFASTDEGVLGEVYAWQDHQDISALVTGVTDARNGQSRVNAALSIPNNFLSHSFLVAPVWDDSISGGPTDYPVSGTIPIVSTAALAITADRPVSGTIPVTSTAALAITADHPASGTIAVTSGASLAITANRPVSGTIPIVSGASLVLVGSAAVYVKRGGVAVLVTTLTGAVKRDGSIIPFGD